MHTTASSPRPGHTGRLASVASSSFFAEMGMQWEPKFNFGDIGQQHMNNGNTFNVGGNREYKRQQAAGQGHYGGGGGGGGGGYGYTYGYGYGPPAYPPQKPSAYGGGGVGGWRDSGAYDEYPAPPPPPPPRRRHVDWDDGAHDAPPSVNKKPESKPPCPGQEPPPPDANKAVEDMPKASPKREGDKPPPSAVNPPRTQPPYAYGHPHPGWGSEGAYYGGGGGGGGYYPPTHGHHGGGYGEAHMGWPVPAPPPSAYATYGAYHKHHGGYGDGGYGVYGGGGYGGGGYGHGKYTHGHQGKFKQYAHHQGKY